LVKRILKKENEKDVKGTYIWLSCTLAVVVTSAAVRGTTISSIAVVMLDVAYIQRPILLYGYSPLYICIDARTWYYAFLHMDD
jgi:hypothetical protein